MRLLMPQPWQATEHHRRLCMSGLQAGLLSTPCLSWDKQIPSLRSTSSRRRRSPGDHIATGMAHGRVTCLPFLKV